MLLGKTYVDAARQGVGRRLVDAVTQYSEADVLSSQPFTNQQKVAGVASYITLRPSAGPKAAGTTSVQVSDVDVDSSQTPFQQQKPVPVQLLLQLFRLRRLRLLAQTLVPTKLSHPQKLR